MNPKCCTHKKGDDMPENFLIGALGSLMFGFIGMVLLFVSYFSFDFFLKKVDISEELNKGNISVAIVVASLLISIALIISSVVH
jgi:uncharacterized membrane protein YjfL (UPF0719 family)